MDKEKLQRLIDEGLLDEVLTELNQILSADSNNDEAYLMRGKVHWKLGEKAQAITDYEHAADINPQSSAVQFLAHAKEVMDFFNPDLLNP